MIDIENLHLTVAGKKILQGIDLHLNPGDTYGLLGPNGAGKSTTIFALLGLRAYRSGRVRVLGCDPAQDARCVRRQVGVMPEKAGFYDWMTASDYLKWHGHLYDSPPTGREIAMMLEKVGLGAEGNRLIETYSRGMKQRLAVARALVRRPRLLVLDEPTNGLDPKGRREIHDLLVEFVSGGKTGVLLCTHLLDDVERLCNRVGIIENGHTRLEGCIADLLTQQGGGRLYRLRLETAPDTANLPVGLTVLGHEGHWWRVHVTARRYEAPSFLWGELWQRGWKIVEIRSEASNLETIYMRHTRREGNRSQEAAR